MYILHLALKIKIAFLLLSGSGLLNAWRRLSTPNLASVLDVRRGVWVRGAAELSNDDPQGTSDKSLTIVTCSHATNVCSSADPQSAEISQSICGCGTFPKCRGVAVSNSGIMSRGFAAATADQAVGLASILTPDVTPCRDIRPNDTRESPSSCSDLNTSDLHCQGCQCQKVVGSRPQGSVGADHPKVGIACIPHPNQSTSAEFGLEGHHTKCSHCHGTRLSPDFTATRYPQAQLLQVYDPSCGCRGIYTDPINSDSLCIASDVRPSNDLRNIQRPSDDLRGDGDTSETSAFRGRSSPFCCNYSNPHSSKCVSDSAGHSLYHELRPYISDEDDEANDAETCSIVTDEEF